MQLVLVIFVLVAMLLATGVALFVYRMSRVATDTRETRYGPFKIRAEANTAKNFDLNYGMVDQTTVRYSIWFNNEPIKFPGDLQTNTGLPFLWKVYTLPGAAESTLIAGSQSLYLIYVKDDQPVVEPLVVQGSDFASLQFLDSNDGQPGKVIEVYMENDKTGMEQLNTLEGGNLLLISGQLVLDVRNRHRYQLSKSKQGIDNYSFPVPSGAIGLSPNRKCIVFRASYNTWNTATEDLPDSEHSVVVYDFEKDTLYSVRYDDTETRMINPGDIDVQWLRTYFEWQELDDGDEVLKLKALDKPVPWMGKFDGQDNYYHLFPVTASMHAVFLDFVLAQMGWTNANILTDETSEYTGRRMVLGDANTKLDIVLKEDEQRISFSKHLYLPYDPTNSYYPNLVRRIADAFDAKLATGKHQEHFGKIISDAKRIRSH